MEINESKIEAKIAQIKAKHEAQAQAEIESYKLSFEVDEAKSTLLSKHKAELKALTAEQAKQSKELATAHAQEARIFEGKYGVSLVPKAPAQSTNDKCKYVAGLKASNGNSKFTLKDNQIIGAKGQPINSTIIYKDADGNLQRLSVSAFRNYLI